MPSPTGGRWREAPDEGKVYVACREKAVFVRLALISPLRRTASPEGEAFRRRADAWHRSVRH